MTCDLILVYLFGLFNITKTKVEQFVEGPRLFVEPSPQDLQGMDFWAVLESDLYHETLTLIW